MRRLIHPVFAASLVLLVCSCSRRPAAGVRVDPALAMLVPQDTLAAAGVKIEALRGTPIFNKYADRWSLPMLDEFIRRAGMDPRKDLWEGLVVSNGKEVAALLRGKFTETGGLEPRIDIPGANRYPYKGYTIIGNEQGGVVFTNSTTAVAGRLSAVRSIIDQRDTARGLPPALAAATKNAPPGQIWGATIGGADFLSQIPLPGNFANLRRVFSGVSSAMFAADLRSGLSAAGYLLCATDADARQIHDAARAVVGLGRLNTPGDQPELLRFYDAIHISLEGRRVNVSAEIPEDLLEKFLARFQR